MISVIVPARNAAATIGETLSSLVPDKALIGEILLIDDGSSDDTVAQAAAIAVTHSLPLSVMSVCFGSAGAARNAGLEQASGDYVFFLDADDTIVPGGLSLLRHALGANPGAGLAVGASIHRASVGNKLKSPGSFGDDRNENVRRYLANELRSITVGSALVVADATAGVRFPESIGLDEDTLYWAKVLMRASVATVAQPVLVYNLDETRMAQRFVSNPRRVFLDVALELNKLASVGIGKDMLQRRKAFIALRVARHLIRRRRYREAAGMLRVGKSFSGGFFWDLKACEYRVRTSAGQAAQFFGYAEPADRSAEAVASRRNSETDR
jgi:glycosyltransferase involved in cell wall biosynthesis